MEIIKEIKLKFDVYDKVNHIIDDVTKGVIVSWRKEAGYPIEYLVTWSHDNYNWYKAHELIPLDNEI